MHYNTEYGKACTATGSTGTAYGTETKNQRKKQRARRSHRVTSRAHYTRLIYLYSTAAVLSRGRFIRSHAYTHMGMVTCSWASMAERAGARSRISLPDQRCWHIGTERDSEDTPAKGDGAVAASTHVVRARSGMQAKRIMRRAARCDGSRWPRGGVGVRGGYLQ